MQSFLLFVVSSKHTKDIQIIMTRKMRSKNTKEKMINAEMNQTIQFGD
jgi:hypothetical protein